MVRKFTEQETETYYDGEDAIYRQLWDEDGKVHWGVFDETTGDDFFKAGLNHDEQMVERGQITKASNVLDMGCGNGTVAMWLSRTVGCQVTGIDLSGVRIGNAQIKLLEQPAELQSRMSFEKASATELPFDDGAFSHVWSQAVIYHVHEQKKCLQEAYRVIEKGGIFVFDDLYKPKSTISPEAQKYVYERLLFDTEYNFVSYQQELSDIGFEVLEAYNLSTHLSKSYARLAEMADGLEGEHKAHFEELAHAYRETVKAIGRQELGWGLFICRK
ncbi:MAG: hypothetical protein ETSY1_08890 [Candidatus Entotheonella factor]|uniref:Methyltransferase type 11 domain-containing protein n=2 Tax=Candidatus Entotheonella TaxID=93171 RepID=W4LT78_ENTF1|nr:MAG: hypothetical protein ETSY1_08890 [Candidatus Entotheonella factor]